MSSTRKKKHWGLRVLTVVACLLVLLVGGLFVLARTMPTRVSQRVALSATNTPAPATEAPQEVGTALADQATEAPTSVPANQAAKTATPAPADQSIDAIVPAELAVNWAVNPDLPEDEWLNVLLLGVDAGDPEEPGRSDTMIVASINMLNGDLKMTSLMRDMYVPIDGHNKNKITSAHWFGGVDLAIKTVNQAFKMNITHYIEVDFSSFAYIVDAIGGIELPVTEEERTHLNQLMADMRVLYPNIQLEKNDLEAAGEEVHLDGMQTLAFSRLRKLDSDFQRTSRQRMVLTAILHKMRSVRNPITLYQLFDIGLEHTRTSLPATDAILLAVKVLANGADFEELRLPADGTYVHATYNAQAVLDPDLAANTKLLHDFIYGTGEED